MIEFVTLVLATYGTALMLVEYDGPSSMFLKLRNKYPDAALKCTVCTSMWVAILFFVLSLFGLGYYLTPLAAVGVVILLESK